MVDEAIINEIEIGIAIKHLTGEVTLEQSIGMAR